MLERILALMDYEMVSHENSIVRGTCPDFTTYREQVAIVATFELAKGIVKKAFAEGFDGADEE